MISFLNKFYHKPKNRSTAKEISFYGVINNEASIDEEKRIGDSIDIAFLVLGKKLDAKIAINH